MDEISNLGVWERIGVSEGAQYLSSGAFHTESSSSGGTGCVFTLLQTNQDSKIIIIILVLHKTIITFIKL